MAQPAVPPAAGAAADTLLLDVGGVLYGDPWETLLLTPGAGLADRYGLDRETVRRAGTALWPRYARRIRAAEEYWAELGETLGVEIAPGRVAELEATLLRPGPDAPELLRRAAARYDRIGLISDNTAFWYPWQAAELRLDDLLDPGLVFLSYLRGTAKSDRPGLYAVAAGHVDPVRTLVIDDRAHNLRRAGALGFRTAHYSMPRLPAAPRA